MLFFFFTLESTLTVTVVSVFLLKAEFTVEFYPATPMICPCQQSSAAPKMQEMGGGWVPPHSAASACQCVCVCVFTSWCEVVHMCRCLSPLSCFLQAELLPSLLCSVASLAAIFTHSFHHIQAFLRVFLILSNAKWSDSRSSGPVCPPGSSPARFPSGRAVVLWMMRRGILRVFMSRLDSETPHPRGSSMLRFVYRCHHVPSIGCNGQWKQHHHQHQHPRGGAGQPQSGGEHPAEACLCLPALPCTEG